MDSSPFGTNYIFLGKNPPHRDVANLLRVGRNQSNHVYDHGGARRFLYDGTINLPIHR